MKDLVKVRCRYAMTVNIQETGYRHQIKAGDFVKVKKVLKNRIFVLVDGACGAWIEQERFQKNFIQKVMTV